MRALSSGCVCPVGSIGGHVQTVGNEMPQWEDEIGEEKKRKRSMEWENHGFSGPREHC